MSDRDVIVKLVQALEETNKYALEMQCATGYRPAGAPNLLENTRLINKVNKDYKIKEIKMGVNIYEHI